MSDCTIIIAEDDAEDRFILEEAFHEVGFSEIVTFVDGGESLLALLANYQAGLLPNLIVLDMNMPRLNGRETLIQLKGSSILLAIPVVMFSTSRNEPEVQACREIGGLILH